MKGLGFGSLELEDNDPQINSNVSQMVTNEFMTFDFLLSRLFNKEFS
jgi:hypothetical protein